jgi:hypothetical protein
MQIFSEFGFSSLQGVQANRDGWARRLFGPPSAR